MDTNNRMRKRLALAGLVLSLVCIVTWLLIALRSGVPRQSPYGLSSVGSGSGTRSTATDPAYRREDGGGGAYAEKETDGNVSVDPAMETLNEYIYWESRRGLDMAMYEKASHDPREFVKRRWVSGMPYGEVKRLYDAKSLPLLYEMLRETQYSVHWSSVASMICFISDDPNSLREIVAYIQRPKSQSGSGFDVVGKSKILAWVGLLPGEGKEKLLCEALTVKGAEKLTAGWIDRPEDYIQTLSRDDLVGLIRGSAAIGIVYSQNKELMVLVEQLYREEHGRCKAERKSTEFCNQLVDAMAIRDLIQKIGLSGCLNVVGTEDNQLSNYTKRYDWYLSELEEKKNRGL